MLLSNMTREKLLRLSKAELIDIVLHQHVQIEELHATLSELEDELAGARQDHSVESLDPQEKGAGSVTPQQHQEEATRDALRHLHDAVYLAHSSLAEFMARLHGKQPQGSDVQQALHQAISAIEPASGQSHQPRRRRRYDVLRLTYLERKKAVEIAEALSISERQYYRDLKAAIRGVTNQILDPRY